MNIFWTIKRLEALSKTLLTLFQAFLIAAIIGGVWAKIALLPLKMLFIIAMVAFFTFGLIFADSHPKKEKGN